MSKNVRVTLKEMAVAGNAPKLNLLPLEKTNLASTLRTLEGELRSPLEDWI